MATFFKYVIGALILAAFIAFVVNSIRSFIDSVKRARESKKKSLEQDSQNSDQVLSDDKKGGDDHP